MGDIVILGAGLAGLSAAYHLEKLGLGYVLYEKESRVGGLCRSEAADGFIFDYSGHLLHFRDGYARSLVGQLLGANLLERRRNSWVYSKGVYTKYPFQSNLYGLPFKTKLDCLLGLMKAKSQKRKAKSESFEEWIYASFGSGVAKHFMLPYNSKLWRVDLSEITPEWTERFVPGVSVGEMVRSAFVRPRIEKGYNPIFYYPREGGIEALPIALAAELKAVNPDREAVRVDWRRKRVDLSDGSREGYSALVSTIPLPSLVEMLWGVPQRVHEWGRLLRWLGVMNVNLGVEDPSLSEMHWIYVPESRFSFYRVGFPMNFSSCLAPRGKSSLYAEVSHLGGRRNPEDSADRVIEDLTEMGVLASRESVSLVKSLNLPYAYVLYDHNYRESREGILGWLEKQDIYSIGRFGGWRYSTMEDAILEGRDIAERIRAGGRERGLGEEKAPPARFHLGTAKSNRVRRDV